MRTSDLPRDQARSFPPRPPTGGTPPFSAPTGYRPMKPNGAMGRRDFVKGTLLGAAALAGGCYPAARGRGELRAYLGTYTVDTGSEGIYHLLFDPGSGALRIETVTRGVRNPSFLALHPDGRSLLAVEEVDDLGAGRSGAVVGFAVDRATGALREAGRAESGGAHPAHLSIDPGRGVALVANYSGGTVSTLRIGAAGRLEGPPRVARHELAAPPRPRQEAPHPHAAYAVGSHVYVPDLGLDRVVAYAWSAGAELVPAPTASLALRPGDGPRHMAFHPRAPFAYVINELSSTLTSLRRDPASGALTVTGTVSTLPEGHTGASFCADVHVHPGGRFLYGSNRGHDSIVVAEIAPTTGTLRVVQHHPTGGSWPRNFALSPDGRFLLVENQRSGDVVTLSVDPDTGRLSPTGRVLEIPAPVCLIFAGEVA